MKREIYFDQQKVWLQMGLGVVCWVGMVLIPISLIRIFLFFIGGSFFYFGSKGFSRKPQIILDDEKIFIGMKIAKSFKWKNVLRAKVIQASVDYRKVDFLELTIRATRQGKVHTRTIETPVHLLKIESHELINLINDEIDIHHQAK
ncbi:MAG: hypothetical protein GY827_09540 [Cytophagales bacterium]|nr:hypothetical protein [Cytophagales bacterium]